ncbi:MAG: ABC transporter substrate-binding protein, partial [Nocardioides sp.]
MSRIVSMLRPAQALTAITALALSASACSLVGSDDDGGSTAADTVVLLTHGDFYLPDETLEVFEAESGFALEVRPSDGVGDLANLVADESGKPSGDVVFGIDNTFASRVLDAGALATYTGELPDGVADYLLPGDDDGALVPVDNGNVCVNVDDAWFAAEGIDPPQSLDDLTDPAYR